MLNLSSFCPSYHWTKVMVWSCVCVVWAWVWRPVFSCVKYTFLCEWVSEGNLISLLGKASHLYSVITVSHRPYNVCKLPSRHKLEMIIKSFWSCAQIHIHHSITWNNNWFNRKCVFPGNLFLLYVSPVFICVFLIKSLRQRSYGGRERAQHPATEENACN